MADNPYSNMFQYPVGEKIDFTDVINNAFARIGNTAPLKSYKALQDYLQGIFYPETIENPTEKQWEINKKFREAMASFLSEKLNQVITDFSFDWGRIKAVQEDGKLIPLTEIESFSHKNYIEVQTVKKRLFTTKNVLYNLQKEDFLKNGKYDEVVKELKQNMAAYEFLLENGPTGTRNKKSEEDPSQTIAVPIIKIKDDENIFKMVKQLDDMYQSITYIYDIPIPNYLLGDVFEKSLELALASMNLEKFAESLTIEALTKKTAGASQGRRGSLKLGMTGYEIITQPGKKEQDNFTYIVKSPTGKKTFKISGVFSEKQQKMDVELDFGPDVEEKDLGEQKFRVSAKNWKVLNKRDFGETDLLGALLRNTTLYDTLTYGLQMGWISKQQEESISYEKQLHRFAQLNLILDIVMGYSQESGYADTIIINDRAIKKIYVYPIKEILKLIQEETTDLSQYSNYNKKKVKEILGDTDIDWSNALSTQEWESKILAALKSMKFNVNTAILKNISLEEAIS